MKPQWPGFRSPLADGIRLFLQTKRALGRKYHNEEKALRLLDAFLTDQAVTCVGQISSEMLDRFLASRPRRWPRSFNHLLGVVRLLLNWLVVQGHIPASPLRGRRRRETRQRVPFLFDASLARQLLDISGRLPDQPKGSGRGPTYRTIFALLYGLGLRVSEACHLLCGDIDVARSLLTVRGGKFGKTRLVPFGPRIAALLGEQLARLSQAGTCPDPTAPLFTFDGRRCVHPGTVSQTFLHLTRQMNLAVPQGCRPPRLHDLRHSFAVGTLLRWYRQGEDPAAKLHYLSTFMGHVDPVSTAVYLTITDDLLREASSRFETHARPTIVGGWS